MPKGGGGKEKEVRRAWRGWGDRAAPRESNEEREHLVYLSWQKASAKKLCWHVIKSLSAFRPGTIYRKRRDALRNSTHVHRHGSMVTYQDTPKRGATYHIQRHAAKKTNHIKCCRDDMDYFCRVAQKLASPWSPQKVCRISLSDFPLSPKIWLFIHFA